MFALIDNEFSPLELAILPALGSDKLFRHFFLTHKG
jgi:hypothetical protein